MQQVGGMLGEILEAGGSLVKMTGQALVATPGSLVRTAASQVTNTPLDNSASGKKADGADLKKQQDDFVKDLYGVNDTKEEQLSSDQTPAKTGQKNEKSPEEQQKINVLKQQLHSQYYQRLTSPPKAPEKPVAEKLADEKMQERWELQEKEAKKPQNLDVVMASQKTEKFRGASG